VNNSDWRGCNQNDHHAQRSSARYCRYPGAGVGRDPLDLDDVGSSASGWSALSTRIQVARQGPARCSPTPDGSQNLRPAGCVLINSQCAPADCAGRGSQPRQYTERSADPLRRSTVECGQKPVFRDPSKWLESEGPVQLEADGRNQIPMSPLNPKLNESIVRGAMNISLHLKTALVSRSGTLTTDTDGILRQHRELTKCPHRSLRRDRTGGT
jgi:hypothetical protein